LIDEKSTSFSTVPLPLPAATRHAGLAQLRQVIGSGAVGHAYQGTSVALSGDGQTAIVGGPNDNQGAGAAWVFTESQVPLRRRAMRP